MFHILVVLLMTIIIIQQQLATSASSLLFLSWWSGKVQAVKAGRHTSTQGSPQRFPPPTVLLDVTLQHETLSAPD